VDLSIDNMDVGLLKKCFQQRLEDVIIYLLQNCGCRTTVQISVNVILAIITRYRPQRGGRRYASRLWQFDGGISFRRQSGRLRQSMDPEIAADLRPPADGSAVRTSLVAGGG